MKQVQKKKRNVDKQKQKKKRKKIKVDKNNNLRVFLFSFFFFFFFLWTKLWNLQNQIKQDTIIFFKKKEFEFWKEVENSIRVFIFSKKFKKIEIIIVVVINQTQLQHLNYYHFRNYHNFPKKNSIGAKEIDFLFIYWPKKFVSFSITWLSIIQLYILNYKLQITNEKLLISLFFSN